MPRCTRRCAIISGGSCFSVVSILGIAALVFWRTGYLEFNDPCFGVESFRVVAVDLEAPPLGDDDESSSWDVLDLLTAGRASALAESIPSQATLTLRIVLEVNNTNPYDLEVAQEGEGSISIVADDPDEPDAAVGTWRIGDSVLEGESRTAIPLEVAATIDLLGDDLFDLAGDLLWRRPAAFRVRGHLTGRVGYAPDFEADVALACLVNVDDVFDLDGDGAGISCRHVARVGRLIERNGRVDYAGEEIFSVSDAVDDACLV